MAAIGQPGLIDDLRLLRRHIVATMLAEGVGLDIDAAFDRYLEARAESYERLTALIDSVGRASATMVAVMVMVHQIRQVVS